MRYIQIVLLSVALGLTACGDDGANDETTDETTNNSQEEVVFKNATLDEFGQTLIGAFRTSDSDLFKKLAINKDKLIENIQNTVQDDSTKMALIDGVTGNSGLWEAFEFTDETFMNLIEVGGKLGVKWEKVVFESIDANLREIEGMQQADGKITFSSDGKRFEFIVFDCRELADGWYGMGLQVEESMLQENEGVVAAE